MPLQRDTWLNESVHISLKANNWMRSNENSQLLLLPLLFDAWKRASWASIFEFDFRRIWISHLQSVDEVNSMEALLSATILLFSPLSSFTEQKLGIITTKNGSAYLISRTEQKLSATSNDYSLPLMYNVKGQYFSVNFGWDNGDTLKKTGPFWNIQDDGIVLPYPGPIIVLP